jgi:bifunctional Delta-12/omega-3 fatty acid desaturase
MQPEKKDEFILPNIKLEDLRRAIPAHCFVPSKTISLLYVARDLTLAAGLVYAALNYIHLIPNVYLRAAAWATYTFLQGCVGTGIWILAHECGHGAFSRSRKLNNVVGWTLHSLLMVPYFSWKYRFVLSVNYRRMSP